MYVRPAGCAEAELFPALSELATNHPDYTDERTVYGLPVFFPLVHFHQIIYLKKVA